MHTICKHISRPGKHLSCHPTKIVPSKIDSVRIKRKRRSVIVALQDNALLFLLLLGQECGTCGVFEDFTNSLVGLC